MVIGFLAACLPEEKEGDGNDGGGTSTKPTVTIKNNTGYTFSGIYFKPSTETKDWGGDYTGWNDLADGKSGEYTLDEPLTVHKVYDIRLSGAGYSGYNFVKFGVTVSNKMTITFSASDLNDMSSLPKITIQNRSGKNFDSVFIVPSALNPTNPDDWGKDFGWIGNNNDNNNINILVAPTNYTVFDIQARSSNPTNTYNKKNVTVTNGMTVLFTPLDKANPTIEDPVIVIQNNTGYSNYVYFKKQGQTDWGSNQLWSAGSILEDKKSYAFSVSRTDLGSTIDIKLGGLADMPNFIKTNVTVSDGLLITFTITDKDNTP